MSQSKQRGTYEQRKAAAIALKELQKAAPIVPDVTYMEDTTELVKRFLEYKEFEDNFRYGYVK